MPSDPPILTAFQRDCIDLFVHGAAAFSLPKSIGEIYGLLFSTEEPLPMDEIISRLQISKGSASQGLRWLRDVGAVRTVYVEGDRRDHYTPVVELRRLASGFLREQVQPHLESGADRLKRLEETVKQSANGHREFQLERTGKLRNWLKFSGMILPLLQKFAVKF